MLPACHFTEVPDGVNQPPPRIESLIGGFFPLPGGMPTPLYNILHLRHNLLTDSFFHASPDRGGLISSPGRKAWVTRRNNPPSLLPPLGSPVGATERRSVAPTGL